MNKKINSAVKQVKILSVMMAKTNGNINVSL